MNNRYKNILLRIIIVVSSVDCWMMLAWGKKSLLSLAVIGVLVGIILCQLHFRSRQEISKINKIISLIVGLLLCYDLSSLCYQTWITLHRVGIIADFLSLNTEIFMKILSYGMALIAFPFVVFGLSKIIQWLVYCWSLIDRRKVWEMSVSSFSVKSLLSVIINIGGAAILGTILLIGAYFLPIASIENHVRSSADIFEDEGTYPSLFFWCTSQLDNFTDAHMLLEAADSTVDSAINKAMFVYHGYISGYDPAKSMVAHYVNGIEYDTMREYTRYWHGYLVLLKPLLEFMDYQSIRMLNAIVQFLLVALIMCLLIWRKMKGYIIPYLLSYFMLMPVALAKSLTFSLCYYIFTIAMITILLLKNKGGGKSIYFIFLNVGIATAFFDYLIYPISTFGVPAVLFLFICSDYELERRLSSLLKSLFCWGAGYAGMWSLKWIIASLITGDINVILNALSMVSWRTFGRSADEHTLLYMLFKCEAKNVMTFIKTPFTLFVVVFIVIMIIWILRKNNLTFRETCKRLIPYIVIGLMPFLWYAFARQHSEQHTFFTNKACVVFVLAIMCGLVELNGLSEKKRFGVYP